MPCTDDGEVYWGGEKQRQDTWPVMTVLTKRRHYVAIVRVLKGCTYGTKALERISRNQHFNGRKLWNEVFEPLGLALLQKSSAEVATFTVSPSGPNKNTFLELIEGYCGSRQLPVFNLLPSLPGFLAWYTVSSLTGSISYRAPTDVRPTGVARNARKNPFHCKSGPVCPPKREPALTITVVA